MLSAGWRELAVYILLISITTSFIVWVTVRGDSRRVAIADAITVGAPARVEDRPVPFFWHDRPYLQGVGSVDNAD